MQMVIAAMKLKDACSLEESYDQPGQHVKKQRHCFANKGPFSQSYGEGNGSPLQYSCLDYPMGRGAW